MSGALYLGGVMTVNPSKITLVIIPKRRHDVAADKNCIPVNTLESRSSKSTERINSKNISFERLLIAQGS